MAEIPPAMLIALGLGMAALWLVVSIVRMVGTTPPGRSRLDGESVIRLRNEIEGYGRIPLAPPGATQLPLALRPGEVVLFRTPCRTWRYRLRPALPEVGELIVTNRRILYFGRGRLFGVRLAEARLLDWNLNEVVIGAPARSHRPLHFYTTEAAIVRELVVALRARDWQVGEGALVLAR